jgi:hypothetical protein
VQGSNVFLLFDEQVLFVSQPLTSFEPFLFDKANFFHQLLDLFWVCFIVDHGDEGLCLGGLFVF